MKFKYIVVATILLISAFSIQLQAQSASITKDFTHIIFKNDYVTYKISISGRSVPNPAINNKVRRHNNQLRIEVK